MIKDTPANAMRKVAKDVLTIRVQRLFARDLGAEITTHPTPHLLGALKPRPNLAVALVRGVDKGQRIGEQELSQQTGSKLDILKVGRNEFIKEDEMDQEEAREQL